MQNVYLNVFSPRFYFILNSDMYNFSLFFLITNKNIVCKHPILFDVDVHVNTDVFILKCHTF